MIKFISDTSIAINNLNRAVINLAKNHKSLNNTVAVVVIGSAISALLFDQIIKKQNAQAVKIKELEQEMRELKNKGE